MFISLSGERNYYRSCVRSMQLVVVWVVSSLAGGGVKPTWGCQANLPSADPAQIT
jgi:hypothetical protein